MKEKGKSINSLMKHIRDHHNIDIGKGRSRDKQELLNMGYFHAYKAYKFVKTIDDPLDIKKFEEIRDIYELDNNLKALLYPVVMKFETAINNYTIDCVVTNSGTDLESIFEYKLNHYDDFEQGTIEYRKEMGKFLNLKRTFDTVIAHNYTKSEIIKHYVHSNQSVPIWAVFEMITLGDLGNFIERLNNNTREKLSRNVGVFDRRFDTDNTLLSKHLYIIKDLRNAIAHNRPVFDCRFRTGNVKQSVIGHLETWTNTKKINFQTITDYILLISYYMKCFNFTKTEIKAFLRSYERLVLNYQKESDNSDNFRKIFDVDAVAKIKKIIAIS
ncbi:MAG TPA: DNA-binding protein [Lactobacillus sp.]|nr:Abi family protein [Ligilactobacillus murinus]HBV48556.1 DNA-binding protein [Lactobacillus sp.]